MKDYRGFQQYRPNTNDLPLFTSINQLTYMCDWEKASISQYFTPAYYLRALISSRGKVSDPELAISLQYLLNEGAEVTPEDVARLARARPAYNQSLAVLNTPYSV